MIESDSPSTKVVTIFGSSGIQGASVLHHLLAHPPPPTLLPLHVRAISGSAVPSPALPTPSDHNTSNLTLTLHTAVPTSLPSLHSAISGSHIVFANTNSWNPIYAQHQAGDPNAPSESQSLRNIVDVCAACEVELLILSTLPMCGEYGKLNYDMKEKHDGKLYAREVAGKGLLKRVVFVELGWYMSNFVGYHEPKVNKDDGFVEFEMEGLDSDVVVPWVSTYTDLGPIVTSLMAEPLTTTPYPYHLKSVPIVSYLASLRSLAETYTKVTGQPARVINPSPPVGVNNNPLPPAPNPSTASKQEIMMYQGALLMAVLNRKDYFADEGTLDLARDLIAKSTRGKLTSWEAWLRETGYDVKAEGFGEGLRRSREKWGGRKFI